MSVKTDPAAVSEMADAMERHFERLWLLPRSITGDGVRQTHDILGEILPLTRLEIPSGTRCFDWTIPPEWSVREAYVETPTGERLLDFHQNTLHLVGYSRPFRGKLSRQQLDRHLHSISDMLDAIPYRTSYYNDAWGFCLTQRQRDSMPDGIYNVVVDSQLTEGSLTISECVLPGESQDEVLISTYTCHPAMANNELSGPLVAAFLGNELMKRRRRLTYRLVFLPETIGAVAYLSRVGAHLKKHLLAGFVATCVGDPGSFTYKRSRRGNTLADRAAEHVLSKSGLAYKILDFYPVGSDERQYCSPGFDLPVGALMRTPPGAYRQYHTSLDNRSYIDFEAMAASVQLYDRICHVLDQNCTYRNTVMFCEPQLGQYGLYPALGGGNQPVPDVNQLLWLLNLADGTRDLLSIAERSGADLDALAPLAARCVEAGLLSAVAQAGGSTL